MPDDLWAVIAPLLPPARPPRWVVERSLAWLARFRRLSIPYERRIEIHFGFTTLACALVTLNQCQRFC